MTGKQQKLELLHQYIAARIIAPWIADYAEQHAARWLDHIGGMAGTWRTDYSECTYYHPQRIKGVLVDLSTVEKVRAYFEGVAA